MLKNGAKFELVQDLLGTEINLADLQKQYLQKCEDDLEMDEGKLL